MLSTNRDSFLFPFQTMPPRPLACPLHWLALGALRWMRLVTEDARASLLISGEKRQPHYSLSCSWRFSTEVLRQDREFPLL